MNDVLSYNPFQDGSKQHARGGVVAIGNFDGVHRGHQALLQRAQMIATQGGLPFQVLTFDPHPRRFFQPQATPFLLTQPNVKNALLRQTQCDDIITLPFTEDLSRLTANEFIQIVLADGLAAKHIVVGQNFVFGYGRQGHVETLLAHGFDVTALAPVMDDHGLIYSSTAVRQAIAVSDIAQATHILGRPWSMTGVVIAGQQRGRTIGFPTANIAWPLEMLQPVFGVYAVNVVLSDSRVVKGIANIGIRPTVDETVTHPLLEVHLFDFDDDLYGQDVAVQLLHFIRPEQKFSGLDALKSQIVQDCVIAKSFV